MSYKGKIGSFPADIRDEINRRLLDGESATQILPWLNQEPRVLEILDERWAEQPVSPQNLSEWRQGGYQDFLRRRERSSHLKTLTEWAVKLSEDVPVERLTGAAQRIMAGHILEMIEGLESTEAIALMEALGDVTAATERSRKNDIAAEKLEIARERLRQSDEQRALEREKFETQSVEKFLQWQGTDAAQQIITSGKPKHVQAELLRELMFGKVEPTEQG